MGEAERKAPGRKWTMARGRRDGGGWSRSWLGVMEGTVQEGEGGGGRREDMGRRRRRRRRRRREGMGKGEGNNTRGTSW